MAKLNPLTLGTDGALRRGTVKKVLVLGVSGMLFFASASGGGRDSGDGFSRAEIAHSREMDSDARRKRILADDEEVFLIIQTFIRTQ